MLRKIFKTEILGLDQEGSLLGGLDVGLWAGRTDPTLVVWVVAPSVLAAGAGMLWRGGGCGFGRRCLGLPDAIGRLARAFSPHVFAVAGSWGDCPRLGGTPGLQPAVEAVGLVWHVLSESADGVKNRQKQGQQQVPFGNDNKRGKIPLHQQLRCSRGVLALAGCRGLSAAASLREVFGRDDGASLGDGSRLGEITRSGWGRR